ncbi:hypothetical protein ASPSYDRAFT_72497 [Aspergillus sydowii CBS 593.65]|uniref:Uncharacterized protein n=1 Tax=Aspergillus sydowii CBS 593.65 TaxID=1036612 RepID=A0A1L9T2V8_9EURO|nr:uncharacterized protein ASPSYDRAFT_72497 [Aspergillus sydowii CBS 593.65]OJJ53643.1 hypothetical protein ASPSYDRAFT_72497 [Aspergillus sydowii CBS 593.65]
MRVWSPMDPGQCSVETPEPPPSSFSINRSPTDRNCARVGSPLVTSKTACLCCTPATMCKSPPDALQLDTCPVSFWLSALHHCIFDVTLRPGPVDLFQPCQMVSVTWPPRDTTPTWDRRYEPHHGQQLGVNRRSVEAPDTQVRALTSVACDGLCDAVASSAKAPMPSSCLFSPRLALSGATPNNIHERVANLQDDATGVLPQNSEIRDALRVLRDDQKDCGRLLSVPRKPLRTTGAYHKLHKEIQNIIKHDVEDSDVVTLGKDMGSGRPRSAGLDTCPPNTREVHQGSGQGEPPPMAPQERQCLAAGWLDRDPTGKKEPSVGCMRVQRPGGGEHGNPIRGGVEGEEPKRHIRQDNERQTVL